MIEIIAGTNRQDSNTLKVAQIIHSMYKEQSVDSAVLDLRNIDIQSLNGEMYGKPTGKVQDAVKRVENADGLHFVVPEYNGSLPGVLKYFIDFWKYPDSFEQRPVAFVGLGGMFGGLRPVEHLQQIMGYRNAFQFPQRVFLINVHKNIENNDIKDSLAKSLLQKQTLEFTRFIQGLKSVQLHAGQIIRPIKKS